MLFLQPIFLFVKYDHLFLEKLMLIIKNTSGIEELIIRKSRVDLFGQWGSKVYHLYGCFFLILELSEKFGENE